MPSNAAAVSATGGGLRTRGFDYNVAHAPIPATNRPPPRSIMMFLALKTLHVACAVLSLSGYVIRGVWMINGSPWLQKKWVKVAPHIVDTLLLAAGIGLALLIRQYPFVQGWLTAKVLALIAYIVVGAIGLKYGKTRNIRIAAWLGAIAIFGYIVLVALTRRVLPFLA
jgi:uncharacterized membrane protein SirB2